MAYAGYGSLIGDASGTDMQWNPGTGSYQTSQRSLFFKTSYVHRF